MDGLHQGTAIAVEFGDDGGAVGRPVKPPLYVPEESEAGQALGICQERVLWVDDGPEVAMGEGETVVDVYDRVDVMGRLLILGGPGSGKTTMLVELARELVERAETSEQDGVPVIFELTGWGQSDKSLLGWMVEELKLRYGVPKGVGKVWLLRGEIVPLLDGLDELGLEGQRDCVGAINEFVVGDVGRRVVVCCRSEEYEAGRVRLDSLHGAIRLEPLSEGKIREYLGALGRSGLWPLLVGNGELLELVRAPFFLTILVTSYRGKAIRSRGELFEAYIAAQFEGMGRDGEYGQEQTRHWLRELARQMRKEKITLFMVEGIQPHSWFERVGDRWIFSLIEGLILGLVLGLVLGPILELPWGLIGVLIVGLIGALITGLIGGLMGGGKIRFEPISLVEINFRRLILGLILGLVVGLLWGVILGLVVGLVMGFQSAIINRDRVSQLVIASAFYVLLVTNLPIFEGGFFVWLFVRETEMSVSRLLVLLLPFMGRGLLFVCFVAVVPVIQHVLLRLFLCLRNKAPWHYAKFLNHATQLRFLQRIGGQFRFVHDLLREHIATTDPPSD